MSDYVIRKGKEQDVSELLALIVELAIYEKEPEAVVITEQQLVQDCFGPDAIADFLVADKEGEIMGIALFYQKYSTWKGRCLFLEDLVVSEKHRRLGIGKALFDKLNIPCAPYQMVNNLSELKIAVESIGLPAILKTATDGYDGKGQFLIQSDSQLDQAWKSMSGVESILEGFVNFKRELSLVAVRGVDNSHEYYPLVENSHHNGILRLTIAPAQNISPKLQQQAESYMRSLLDEMNHIGVLTIELFETDNKLVVNEMAPRVHNSGHWTIEGARTSQFENHIRAITETPLGDTSCTHKYSAMINIIGEQGPIDKALTLKNAHLHLYNKTEREGRKLGHITITANTVYDLNTSLETLSDFMP